MLVKVLKECGYEEALLGLSLSYYDHKIPLTDWDWEGDARNIPSYDPSVLETTRGIYYEDGREPNFFWTDDKYTRAERRARALAFHGGGHNKFLESITVWLFIQAPRCWWSEYDTYRVGMTKNSSSTMHTLDKRMTESYDYELGTSLKSIEAFNDVLALYKAKAVSISELKCNLPEGYLQERQITTNYMTLQNILNQREGHRLRFWNTHREEVLKQLKYPELLVKEELQ
jgi:hypothetical protein